VNKEVLLVVKQNM